ncbi:hypothetical protein KH5H1_20490 [Corallococcus caeni]|nr:hypothetical protein KH5H1_20490 [Corallococcus sp. KH5-1]
MRALAPGGRPRDASWSGFALSGDMDITAWPGMWTPPLEAIIGCAESLHSGADTSVSRTGSP